jgi:hypothetical protein
VLSDSPVFIDLLLENLDDPDEWMRLHARVRLLAHVGKPEVLTALQALAAREPDSGFGYAIEQALSPQPPRPRRFRFWPF